MAKLDDHPFSLDVDTSVVKKLKIGAKKEKSSTHNE